MERPNRDGEPGGDGLSSRVPSVDASEESRLAWVTEQVPLGVVEWSTDRRIRYWNEAATDIFGYEAEEIRGERGEVLVPDDEPDRFEDNWQRLVAADGNENVLTDNVRKDGMEITCEWYNTPLYEDGSLAGVLSMVRDVTDRERRQRTVATLHETTRDLMEARTPTEIATIGVETAEDVLDLPYTIVLQYDEDDEVLRPTVTSEAYDERFDASPTFEVGEGISGEAYATGEIEIHDNGQADPRAHPEGPPSIRSFTAFPLGKYGVLTASSPIVGAFDEQDVEAARVLAANMEAALARAERERTLRRQNERLDEFASVVSHDLRNPLSVARGNVELAQEAGDLDRLDTAADALERMDTLIDGLLTLARDGELAGERVAVDLADCARRAFDEVEAADASLTVASDLGTVRADADHLRELLGNLFGNAAEHSDGPVEIRVGPLDDDTGFFVADDGPGIPAADREDVFDHGYSGEGSTGIGLAVVEELADAHDWSVTVTESDRLGGARFEVST